MAKFLSGRQRNLSVGINSFTEDKTVLDVVGKVGIGTTNAQNHSLFVVGDTNVVGDVNVSGVVTASGGFNIGIQSGGVNITTGVVTALNFIGSGNTFSYNSTTKTVNISISAAGIATYADTAGIAIYASNAGIATYASNAGIATYADTAGIATYADTAGIATYASNAGIATFATTAGIATYASVAGIATYASNAGIATYASNAGIATYASNAGIATYADTAGIATYADTAGIATYASNAGIATYADVSGIATALQNARTFEITGDVVASPITFDGTGNVSLAATIQPNSVELGADTFGDYVESISGTSNEITVTGGTGEGSTPVISFAPNPTISGNVTIGNDLQVNNNLNVTGNITVGGTSAYIIVQDFRVTDADITLGFTTDAYGNDVSNDTTANHGGIAVASTEGNPLITLTNPGVGETLPATYKKIMWFKAGSFAGLNTDAWLSNYAIGIGSTQFPSGTRLAAGSVQFTENDLAVVRNINASGIVTSTGGFIGNLTGTASTASFATTAFSLNGIIEGDLNVAFAQTAGIATFATNAGIATNLKGGIAGNVPYQSAPDTTTFVTNGSSGQVLLFNGSIPIWSNVSDASGAFGGITVYDEGNLVGTSGSITSLDFVSPNLIVTGTSGANGIATIRISDNLVGTGLSISGVTTSIGGFVGNLTGTATTATNLSDAANITTGTIDSARLAGTYNIDISGNAATADYADVAGIATYAFNAGIATYASVAGIATYADVAGISTNVIGGIASVIQLSVSGISTFSNDVFVGSGITMYATTGIVSATAFYGNGQNLSDIIAEKLPGVTIREEGSIVGTEYQFSQLNFAGDYVTATGIGSIATITFTTPPYSDVAGIATYASNAGIATYASNAGIATYADVAGIATYASNAGIATYADVAGIATYASNAGIATYADVAGIATYADVAGIATYASNADISTYASVAGIATYASNAGIATYASNAGIATYADVAGIATYASNAGIATYADVAGIATYASSAGIATYASNADISTYASVAGIATYASNAGISTFATTAGTATTATNIDISATSSGDTTTHVVLVGDNVTGGQQPFIDNGSLIYNASTNVLTAGGFNGDGASLTSLNASQLTSGTIPGDRGVTSGSTSSSFVEYNGTTKTAGQFDGGTTNPTNTTRLNYDGYLYATRFYGDGSNLTGAGSTVFNDTTTNQNYYPLFTSITSGTITASGISTSKLTYNPSSGEMTAVNFNSTSDENLKTNIQTVENALNIVNQLRGVSFDWKESGKSSYGVIAQELEDVLPELVNGIDQKSVNYNGIIGVLIEAIKELKNEILELKNNK